ncbi:hypothetical protein KKC88_00980 [Patescibacteria group bacterium]|nr:hypothetical protein [Patescibacteria group bacterium]MBU1673333.1 hypothetical protein [Patescibacteria group bacterium]MBU1963548.1 hypothetical protein [Patescibacteria group bacterium]
MPKKKTKAKKSVHKMTDAELKREAKKMDAAIRAEKKRRQGLLKELDKLEAMFMEFRKKKYLDNVKKLKQQYKLKK